MANPRKKANRKSDLKPFFVAGIGASAGGLDAFKRLLKALPRDTGMAFVLVQHLDPSHESLLTEILGKVTELPILEITDDIILAPDHVYIIPPNKTLTVKDGTLKLSPRNLKAKKYSPIDIFFTALAEAYQELAVGVVLSGTASDGSLGLKAIKEYGGITFAQEPTTAAYDSMPQSAIYSGVVDFILPPELIPGQFLQIIHNYKASFAVTGDDAIPKDKEEIYRQILSLLHHHGGVDFTYYKKPTIRRRLARRMAIQQKETLNGYLNFLRSNKPEMDALYKDVLVPVTSFFRDPKTFQALKEMIFPSLFKKRSVKDPLRVWVAGCSTGEEAYSVAISLNEFRDTENSDIKIQIFATDVSEKSILKARSGIYTKQELESVPEDVLKRYFTKSDGSYHVHKFIRDMCIFATHNFIKDPPFARLDLILCRNVLIYMDPYLQKKAFSTFHYALKEKGFLMLGKSESATITPELFNCISRADKFFTRRPGSGRFEATQNEKVELPSPIGLLPKKENAHTDFRDTAEEILLNRYTPSGVIVNEQFDVVYIHGATGDFLEPSPGKPSLNLLKLAREGIAFELRNTLHKAKNSKATVIKEDVPITSPGERKSVTIEVVPLNTVEPHYLILFRQSTILPAHSLIDDTGDGAMAQEHKRIEQLEKELSQTRGDMRSILEDQEAANEELQSANEELLSNTEELQSINEELETSKEELQSGNEELIILNQELIDRQKELNDARVYAEAIFATIREPLVILDKDLRIKSANPSFYSNFNLTVQECESRPFFEVGNHMWDIKPLKEKVEDVLVKKNTIKDHEVKILLGGEEKVLLVNATQIVKINSNEPLILVAAEDITVRLITEKQAMITENLRQTNLQLEQFGAMIGHDLKEPLRKIVTFISILKIQHKDELTKDLSTALDKIEQSSIHMTNLIRDLLNYAKMTDINKILVPTDLHEIVKKVLVDFETVIENKKAKIRVDDLPVIESVPLQMLQLFSNLVGNSLKFSKTTEPPAITISSRMLLAKDVKKLIKLDPRIQYCEILVKDNGIGFDEKYASQAFEIFKRLHPPSKYEGTGLGLALCKKIVENHHGEIFVNSEENNGTTMHVILPVRRIH